MYHRPEEVLSGLPFQQRAHSCKRFEILSILWRGKRWPIYGMLFSIGIAALFLSLTTPRYLAISQILINPADSRIIEKGENGIPRQYDAPEIQIETQTHVLTSEILLGRVVDKLLLDQDTDFARSRLDAMMDSIAEKTGFHVSGEEIEPGNRALRALEKMVTSRRQRGTYVVDVQVETFSSEKSVAIARAIVQAYLEDQAAVRSDAAHRVTQALTSRLEELKLRVRDAEERVEGYRVKNDIIEANGTLATEQQFIELNNQLARARARTAEAKAIQSRIPNFSLADPSRNVPARGDLDRALALEQSLENRLDALKREAVRKSQAIVRLRELQRDVDASRGVFESFLLRANEMREQERMDTSNVRVISNATLPGKKIWPPRSVFVLATSLVLGALAGGGIAWGSHLAKEQERPQPTFYQLQFGALRPSWGTQISLNFRPILPTMTAILKIPDTAPHREAPTPGLPVVPESLTPQATPAMFDLKGPSSEMPLPVAPSIFPSVAMRSKDECGTFDAVEETSTTLGRLAGRSRTRSSRATKVPQIETALDETS
jgi:succinoglycan biosynthesis transport protein ExoP